MDFGDEQFDLDAGMFPVNEVDPKAEEAARKAREREAKKKPSPPPTKAQIDAAKSLGGEMKHEKEVAEKSRILRLIKQYYKKFGDEIDVPMPRKLSIKMTLEELQHLLSEVELDLNSSGAAERACMGYEWGIGLFQDINQQMGTRLALSGPRADLKGSIAAQRATWVPIVEKLAVKYERYFAVGPERQLLFFTASLIALVHRANTVNIAPNATAQEAPTKLQEEAATLI